jgi:hypothetical protein
MATSKIPNARYVSITTTFSDFEARKVMEWIERQNPKPNRSTAIRNLVLAGIGLRPEDYPEQL